MAIIHCPQCDRRISSQAPACPHCDTPTGEMSDEERSRLMLRRWRTRMYRARNLTYIAMGLVVAGALWWFFVPPEGLALPVPVSAGILMAGGMAVYLAGWLWIVYLKLPSNRPRA